MRMARSPAHSYLDEWTAPPADSSDAAIGQSNTVTAARRGEMSADLYHHRCSMAWTIISITLPCQRVSRHSTVVVRAARSALVQAAFASSAAMASAS